MAESEKSVTWVIVAIMLLIAALGWGFMAAGYARSEQGWRTGGVEGSEGPSGVRRASRRALADFVANAFEQIPNAGAVVTFNFTNRIWLPALIGVLEVLTLLGGFKMKQLERELNSSPRRGGPGR